MKLICERDALDRALGMVIGRVRASKNKGEILGNVKLVAEGRAISVTTTDMSTRSETACAAEIESPGATTVPADRLARLVDLMPKGAQVSLRLQDKELQVCCGRSSYLLPTLPVDIFPDMSQLADPIEFSLGCLDAKRMFGDPTRGVTVNGSRPYLEGGCLQYEDGGLSVTGCDGTRLVRVILPGDVRFPGRYIVPKSAMNEIVKLSSEGEIEFRCGSNLIEVKARGCTFTSKLIDGTYPDMKAVIPGLSATFVTVARDEFTSALKRLCGLANDFSTIDLSWSEGSPHLEMSSSGEGSGSEQVACECTLAAGTISFAPAIISEMLEAFDGELLQFHITDSRHSMRIVDPDVLELTVLASPCAPRAPAPNSGEASEASDDR